MLEIWGDAGDSFVKWLWKRGEEVLEFSEMGGTQIRGGVFEMGRELNPSMNNALIYLCTMKARTKSFIKFSTLILYLKL